MGYIKIYWEKHKQEEIERLKKDAKKLFGLGHLRDRIKTPEIMVMFNKLIKEAFEFYEAEIKRLGGLRYEDIYIDEGDKIKYKY